MDDKPAEWAIARANEIGLRETGGWLDSFARYIEAHEEPPADPLLGVVEEAIAGTAEKGAIQLREALAKRGLKIVEADHA